MQLLIAQPRIFVFFGLAVLSFAGPLSSTPPKTNTNAKVVAPKTAVDNSKKTNKVSTIAGKTVKADVPKIAAKTMLATAARAGNRGGDPACGGTVVWANQNTCATGISTDVVDTNIDVSGTNDIVGPVHVIANTCSILVTVTNGDAVITGCETSVPRLYLWANTSQTITFSLAGDLMFRGTALGATPIDLLVSVSGPGTVVFNIFGDETVTFSSLPTSGGALLYVDMSSDNPQLQFSRMPGAATDNANTVEVGVGPQSLIGYISSVANPGAGGLADIQFDTSNTGTGRMVLRVANQGEVLISPRLLGATGDYLITDIDLTTLGGGTATFEIANSMPAFPGSLLIINENNVLTNLMFNPFCDGAFNVTGTQLGFILGSNGVMEIDNLTYVDYVGTVTNQCPVPYITLSEELTEQGLDLTSVVKVRNPSAFIVDAAQSGPTPLINFFGNSGLYFRSGVDEDGVVQETVDGSFSFTIDPTEVTLGAGNLVFDVEGAVDLVGTNSTLQAMNVLSIYVTPTGGQTVIREGLPFFPDRTFATDSNGNLLRYNSAYVMVNGRMSLNDVSLVHSDVNHLVYENDDQRSEPTYIGGDLLHLVYLGICPARDSCSSFTTLTGFESRPKILFFNAPFHVHFDVALTGVDLLTTNLPTVGNTEQFIFYTNGRAVDNGLGRQMILGTDIGSFACDGGTIIDRDSHFDIIQEMIDPTPGPQQVQLVTDANDDSMNNLINPAIPLSQLESESSIHTIYLGHGSNISMGVQESVGTNSLCTYNFALTTTPNLNINGCYFSFETQGGNISYPEESGVTGQGGIFIDTNGLFDVAPTKRANISSMVTKSSNGRVNLPPSQIFFNLRIGISNWQLDLSDPSQLVIIPPNSEFTNYTLDWIATMKDYTGTDSWTPYEFCNVNPVGFIPVMNSNLIDLPIIQGLVHQFQIKRSRLGDMAHIKVSTGGYIRELVYLSGYDSAEAPTGVVIVENGGRVGLGSASRDEDSTQAAVVLGINGVTIIPNYGGGIVEVNDSLLINNYCHILSGTAFGQDGNIDFLTFRSEIEKEIRVVNGGVLDLTSFTGTNQIVEFAGQLKLVLEVGSTVKMGGGTLLFSGQSGVIVQTSLLSEPIGTPPATTEDTQRAVFAGTGIVQFTESSQMLVTEDAWLGVETSPTNGILTTSLQFLVQDGARIAIGDIDTAGGVWQIGDTAPTAGCTITFSLILDGINASFVTDHRGFFGLGAGVVVKPLQAPSNEWEVASLNDISNITINIPQGTFTYNSIVDGGDPYSTMLALGGNSGGAFTFLFDPVNAIIQGGGNLIWLSPTIADDTITVSNFAGTIATIDGTARVGMMSSLGMLVDSNSAAQPVNVSSNSLFNYLQVRDYRNAVLASTYATGRATFAVNSLGSNILGYEQSGTLFRSLMPAIIGRSGTVTDPRRSLEYGWVGLILNANNSIASVAENV